MAAREVIELIDQQQWLDPVGESVQKGITGAFETGGCAGKEVKNFLHGTWLGHPLHPVLTDVPVGAWTAAVALDALDMVAAAKEGEGPSTVGRGADAAIAVGLAGAVGAAITGMTDWQHTDGRARRIGLMHGMLNGGATVLFAASLILRKRGSRGPGQGLSLLGYLVASASAYLGGHLVYKEQIGVNHTADKTPPDEWTPVLGENELADGEMRCVKAGDVRVLLVRRGVRIHGMVETCSHLGGPLSEGKLEGDSVRCPWHGSRFSLEDGRVLDGPSTYQQPCVDTRIREEQIEVRLRPGTD